MNLSLKMTKSSLASPAKVGNLTGQGLVSSNLWMWRVVWFRVALFWARQVSMFMIPVLFSLCSIKIRVWNIVEVEYVWVGVPCWLNRQGWRHMVELFGRYMKGGGALLVSRVVVGKEPRL